MDTSAAKNALAREIINASNELRRKREDSEQQLTPEQRRCVIVMDIWFKACRAIADGTKL